MNAAQVQTIRQAINNAYAAGDTAKAERLQDRLHDHFAKQADQFVTSAEGVAHMDALLNKHD